MLAVADGQDERFLILSSCCLTRCKGTGSSTHRLGLTSSGQERVLRVSAKGPTAAARIAERMDSASRTMRRREIPLPGLVPPNVGKARKCNRYLRSSSSTMATATRKGTSSTR